MKTNGQTNGRINGATPVARAINRVIAAGEYHLDDMEQGNDYCESCDMPTGMCLCAWFLEEIDNVFPDVKTRSES